MSKQAPGDERRAARLVVHGDVKWATHNNTHRKTQNRMQQTQRAAQAAEGRMVRLGLGVAVAVAPAGCALGESLWREREEALLWKLILQPKAALQDVVQPTT